METEEDRVLGKEGGRCYRERRGTEEVNEVQGEAGYR